MKTKMFTDQNGKSEKVFCKKNCKMKSKHNEIRVLGQRSIPLSFFSGSSSNLGKDSKDDVLKEGTWKNSSISFSDFLDQKLHTDHVVNKTVKGKSRPFKSPLGSRDDCGSINHLIGTRKVEEVEKNSAIDQVVFEQFKPTSAEKGDNNIGSGDGGDGGDVEHATSGTAVGVDLSLVDKIGSSNSNNEHVTRKRRNPFEDGDSKHTTRKHLLVLGDDPESRQKAGRKRFLGNKKTRSSFNHYGNGCGWWDCDMEGVDTEEVGLGDVWEGVGSTTFGVIDWH
ncbi:uncharacterized protein LOC8258021 [Ricinus communis]|uniref:uncharacterized protein LOC8258021 n=1 Tax=Ricinus communis TaxID=3988 RepID=UPI00201A6A92|nr:uncharacterized protein LOC8258021 [Ricinus communis]